MTAQRGSIFRTEGGLWAIRYRDAHGRRPQETGFRTKGEAREALEEALRRVRLGSLYRPTVTLRELTDAFLEQHDVAPSTLAWLRDNMRPALKRFGDEPIGSLKVDQLAAMARVAAGGQALSVAPGAAAGAAGGGALEVDRGQPGGAGQEPGAEAGRDPSVRVVG